MLKFIVIRLLSAIPVLIGISLVSFIIIQLPPLVTMFVTQRVY